MAAGNGNQQQNNNQTEESRKIAGTNETYTGIVVKLGEFEYTTVGGGIEGDRQQLESMDTNTPELNIEITSNTSNNNPVTRTFTNRYDATNVSEYLNLNGTPVGRGAKLHEHQNGQVMRGHNPNNMGAVVTLNPLFGRTDSNQNIPPIGTGTGGTNQSSNNQLMGDPGRSANLVDPAFIMDLIVPENSTGGGTGGGNNGGSSY